MKKESTDMDKDKQELEESVKGKLSREYKERMGINLWSMEVQKIYKLMNSTLLSNEKGKSRRLLEKIWASSYSWVHKI